MDVVKVVVNPDTLRHHLAVISTLQLHLLRVLSLISLRTIIIELLQRFIIKVAI